MKAQTQTITQIFAVFSAWAGRGLQYAQKPSTLGADDLVQEYEAGVMPVLPPKPRQFVDDHSTN